MKAHILAMAAGLAVALGGGCQTLSDALAVRKPTASLKGVSFDKIGLESATLLFDVEVQNHYSVPLPLVNMDYSLRSAAQPLLSGQADLATTIPAQSSKTVSLPATVSYLDLWNAFKGIKPGVEIPYRADLGLSVDAPVLGRVALPLAREGRLAVPAIPKLDQVDWKSKILDAVRRETP